MPMEPDRSIEGPKPQSKSTGAAVPPSRLTANSPPRGSPTSVPAHGAWAARPLTRLNWV